MAVSVFFLLPGVGLTGSSFKANLSYLFRVHGLAFLLMGFWLVPLLVFLPNTTRFNILWVFHSWKQFHEEVFPAILYPFAALAIVGTVRAVVRGVRRKEPLSMWGYVWFLALSGLILYGVG